MFSGPGKKKIPSKQGSFLKLFFVGPGKVSEQDYDSLTGNSNWKDTIFSSSKPSHSGEIAEHIRTEVGNIVNTRLFDQNTPSLIEEMINRKTLTELGRGGEGSVFLINESESGALSDMNSVVVKIRRGDSSERDDMQLSAAVEAMVPHALNLQEDSFRKFTNWVNENGLAFAETSKGLLRRVKFAEPLSIFNTRSFWRKLTPFDIGKKSHRRLLWDLWNPLMLKIEWMVYHGIFHNDIRFTNLLVGEKGKMIVINDFGCVKLEKRFGNREWCDLLGYSMLHLLRSGSMELLRESPSHFSKLFEEEIVLKNDTFLDIGGFRYGGLATEMLRTSVGYSESNYHSLKLISEVEILFGSILLGRMKKAFGVGDGDGPIVGKIVPKEEVVQGVKGSNQKEAKSKLVVKVLKALGVSPPKISQENTLEQEWLHILREASTQLLNSDDKWIRSKFSSLLDEYDTKDFGGFEKVWLYT